MLIKWSSHKHCTKRQLQSLIGKLHFIPSVCRPGRTFVRRMIDLHSKASHPSHRIRLTFAFRKEIHWWQTFLTSWNGCSFFYQDTWLPNSSLELFTDASHAALCPEPLAGIRGHAHLVCYASCSTHKTSIH